MATYYYESYDDEAVDYDIFIPVKPPITYMHTSYVTGRGGSGKAMRLQLPTNFLSLASKPANELRFKGGMSFDSHSGGPSVELGAETWLGYSVFIPSDEYPNLTGTTMTITQFHGGSEQTVPFSFRITTDGTFDLLMRAANKLWVGPPVVHNKWYDVVIHTKWSTTPSGLAQIWIDGDQFVDYTGKTTEDTSDGFVFLKYGMYCPQWRREPPTEDKTLYFDEWRFGKDTSSYSEVDPAQGSAPEDPEDPPTPPPSGTGIIVVRKKYTNSPTNTTSIPLTDTEITGTPAAGLVFSNAAGLARLGIGAIVGSTIYSGAIASRDGSTTLSARRYTSNASLVQMGANGTSTIEQEAAGTLGTGGLTITKSTTPTTAAEILAMLFAGADVQAAVGILNNNTTQNSATTVSGLAFQPNLLIFLNMYNDFSTPGNATQLHMYFGMATLPTNQYSFNLYQIHNTSPLDVRAHLSDKYIMQQLNSNAALELTEIASDGFSVTTRGAAGDFFEVMYVAFNIDANIYLHTVTTPEATGAKTFEIGFAPQAAMMLSTLITTLNSTKDDYQAGAVCVGMLDEDGHRALSISIDDAVTTGNSESQSNDKFVYVPNDDGTALIQATASLGTTSVDATYTGISANAYGILLAIEHVEPPSYRQKLRSLRQGLRFGLRAGW